MPSAHQFYQSTQAQSDVELKLGRHSESVDLHQGQLFTLLWYENELVQTGGLCLDIFPKLLDVHYGCALLKPHQLSCAFMYL